MNKKKLLVAVIEVPAALGMKISQRIYQSTTYLPPQERVEKFMRDHPTPPLTKTKRGTVN